MNNGGEGGVGRGNWPARPRQSALPGLCLSGGNVSPGKTECQVSVVCGPGGPMLSGCLALFLLTRGWPRGGKRGVGGFI